MAMPSARNVTEATPTVSEAVAAIATVPVTCAPPAGDVTLTVGGVVSIADPMITATGADIPTLPALSRACARSVCDPFATLLVFQRTLYGGLVSVSMAAPSARKVTDTTPTASEAVAVMLTLRPTCAPAAGEVMFTDGAVVSRGNDCASGACDRAAASRTTTIPVRTRAMRR